MYITVKNTVATHSLYMSLKLKGASADAHPFEDAALIILVHHSHGTVLRVSLEMSVPTALQGRAPPKHINLLRSRMHVGWVMIASNFFSHAPLSAVSLQAVYAGNCCTKETGTIGRSDEELFWGGEHMVRDFDCFKHCGLDRGYDGKEIRWKKIQKYNKNEGAIIYLHNHSHHRWRIKNCH